MSSDPVGVFTEIPGASAILRRHGLFVQANVYRRGDALYARYGRGFIRLYVEGTSVPNILLDELIIEEKVKSDGLRRLQITQPKPVLKIGRNK